MNLACGISSGWLLSDEDEKTTRAWIQKAVSRDPGAKSMQKALADGTDGQASSSSSSSSAIAKPLVPVIMDSEDKSEGKQTAKAAKKIEKQQKSNSDMMRFFRGKKAGQAL